MKPMMNSYAPMSYNHSTYKNKSITISPHETSSQVDPNNQARTFFVDKGDRILLFKDIHDFYTMGEEKVKITGKMLGFVKEFEYEGEIISDAMQGKGELKKDDKIYIGRFNDNKLVEGMIVYGPDVDRAKMKYNGMIKDWKREGEGELVIGKYKISAHFSRDELREDLPVILFESGKELGPVDVISTKNPGMYLLQEPSNDDMFIFDINKQKLRKSY